jgi:hypothetical protein
MPLPVKEESFIKRTLFMLTSSSLGHEIYVLNQINQPPELENSKTLFYACLKRPGEVVR